MTAGAGRAAPLVLSLLLVLGVSGHALGACDSPRFEEFAAPAGKVGKPAPADTCCHPDARRYRTMLRDGAKRGPNFAGRYTVVTWGCGMQCRHVAIVDARSGKVHFPDALRYNAYPHLSESTPPFEFRRDSRLLIVRGAPNGGEEEGVFYFLWEDDRLRQVSCEGKKNNP